MLRHRGNNFTSKRGQRKLGVGGHLLISLHRTPSLPRSLQREGEKGSALAPGSGVWKRGEWCEGLRSSGVGLYSNGDEW
jgi:hypothetical protein